MEDHEAKYHYLLTLAGATIGCSFLFPDTASYFGAYCRKSCSSGRKIALTDIPQDSWLYLAGSRSAYNEYTTFTTIVSDALLEYDRCIIHGAAVRYRDHAFLIVAPSGVGKSTQVKTLQMLYPGEFSVICGDRPVLEKISTGVMVHPSPWNGKENWYGADPAPLSGIFCLRRGEKDEIQKLSPQQAAAPLYTSFIQTAEMEDNIKKFAAFESSILKNVPVWRLTNRDVPGSTKLLYEAISEVAPDEL